MSDIRNRLLDCGCFDEWVGHRAFSLKNAAPMPERAEFIDDCMYMRHYCESCWQKREDTKARIHAHWAAEQKRG